MRRNVINVMMVMIVAVAFGITAGCGGGSDSPTTTTTTGFTTAMISGNTLADSIGPPFKYNADGTCTKLTSNATYTWSVNSNGKLIRNTTILTLLSGNITTGLNYSALHTDNTTDIGTFTLYTGFTTAMLAGKSMTSPHGTSVDTTTFNAGGTWVTTRVNPSAPSIQEGFNSGTWTINSIGQLVITTTATSYSDTVLNVPKTLTLASYKNTGMNVLSSDDTSKTFTFL